MIAIIYHIDGTVEEREVGTPSVREMQQLVGGYVRVVPPTLLGERGRSFERVFVDEDGYPNQREPNLRATRELGFREPGPFLGTVVCFRKAPPGW